ncbi:BREX system P-loop protein BrxC, partial [bacterium]
MQIRSIFEKDIARPINGVVKADQLDQASVWQELDEYVVTKEIDEHLRGFFGAYMNALDNQRNPEIAGRIGVWVSGFFGSGKSHFLKILSYLLENRSVARDGRSQAACDFFRDKIEDGLFFADIERAVKSSAEVVLFNIDSKAERKSGDPILGVFTRVFNEKLGYSGDHPHIARLERELDARGKLQAFHEAFLRAKGSTWLEERDAYDFH